MSVSNPTTLTAFEFQMAIRAGIVEFLAAIDPDELEKAALARLESFDDTTATAHMLELLSEWAAGT